MQSLCPICNKAHTNLELQNLELLNCAIKLCKKSKSPKGFRRKFEIFITYLDNLDLTAIEARAYLIEFDALLSNTPKERRAYFGPEKILSEATRMRERQLSKRARAGEVKRPKNMCPICYKFHFSSAEIPDTCWSRALKGDISTAFEFHTFLKANNYGELSL